MNSNLLNMSIKTEKTHKPCLEFSNDSYSENEYCQVAWPALEQVLITFLNQRPGQYVPIKYEEMYCHIYRCVCKDYRERLYNDLISFVTNHVEKLNFDLKFAFEQSKQNISLAYEFIIQFNNVLIQYQEACKGIVAIFHYLNINYIKQKLRSDLNEELINIFTSKLIDNHIQSLITMIWDLEYLQANSTQSELLYSLIETLYKLKSEYAKINQELFYKYSKSFLTDFKNDYDNKLNNNYINPLKQTSQLVSQSKSLIIQQQQLYEETTTTQSYLFNNENINQPQFQQSPSHQQQQRKRHAEEHSSEPRAKIFC